MSRGEFLSSFLSISIICLGIFFFIPLAQAQQVGYVSISANPSFPEPNSTVSLKLDDYSINTLGLDIYWYRNGVELKEFRNERNIAISSGTLGETTQIDVSLFNGGVITHTATHTLKPIQLDIILEAETSVPSFYKGRALPSSESTVRAVAVIQDGTGISWDTYSYKWTLGETVLSGGAVKGKYAVTVTTPRLSGNLLVLEVYNSEGDIVGKKAVPLSGVRPFVLFYSYSPLRGLIQQSITSLVTDDSQTIIHAEPFFLNTKSLSPENVDIVWKQDRLITPNGNGAPNTFTLNDSTDGEVSLGAVITTKSSRPQQVQDYFMVVSE